jgi:hypothetical protein
MKNCRGASVNICVLLAGHRDSIGFETPNYWIGIPTDHLKSPLIPGMTVANRPKMMAVAECLSHARQVLIISAPLGLDTLN